MMTTKNLDKLVMLLSTDWFQNYWPSIGLVVEKSTRFSLQQSCRKLVEEIALGVDEYWLASFSADRLKLTHDHFFDAISKVGLNHEAVNRLQELTDQAQPAHEVSGTTWLLGALTDMLLENELAANGVEPPGDGIKSQMVNAWEKNGRSETDFSGICLSSNSDWDRYIRGLTPDLPMLLADYVTSEIQIDRFALYWETLKGETSDTERASVIAWYQLAANMLSGQECQLPHWM